MESVHQSGIPVLVTKRGKPLVRVIPVREDKTPTRLEGAITHEAEDIFSTGETFEAACRRPKQVCTCAVQGRISTHPSRTGLSGSGSGSGRD